VDQHIIEFWNWFSLHAKRFWNYNQENSHLFLTEIQERLAFVTETHESGLALEFAEISDSIKRLEVSADGVIDLFDTVIRIVELAPDLENWEFAAFRQPVETPFCLEFEDMVFDTSKMFFFPYENEHDELNVAVFGENFKNYEENNLFLYGLTTIDNLIGEYDCVTKIKGYDFLDIEEMAEYETYPLEDLPDFLNSYYSELPNDPE
jgi:hypothetical protein